MYPRPFGRIYVGLEFFTSNIEVSCPTTDPSEAQKLKSQNGSNSSNSSSQQPSNPRSEFSVQLFRHFPNRNVFGDPDHQPTFPPLLLLRFPPDAEFGRPGSIGRAAAAAVASASARAKNKIRQKKLEKPRTFPE